MKCVIRKSDLYHCVVSQLSILSGWNALSFATLRASTWRDRAPLSVLANENEFQPFCIMFACTFVETDLITFLYANANPFSSINS